MIVAEIGVNWDWTNLHERFSAIRETGATWVKGQLFYPYQAPVRFAGAALHLEQSISNFRQQAAHAGLIPIFTPMHIDLVRFCDRGHIKIRYKDKDNDPLIRLAKQVATHVWISGKDVLCAPKYPAHLWDYGVRDDTLSLSQPAGISSHLPDVNDLLRLIRLCQIRPGHQTYIEAHVKFSEGDHEAPWSLSTADFKKLVEWEQGK